jgi:hypothetical protein
MIDMFTGAALSTANYDLLLIGWNNLASLQNDTNFSAGNSEYSPGSATTARANIISTYNWSIYDGGSDTTAPTVTFTCSPLSVTVGVVITCTCSGSDSGSGVDTTSYTANPSTSAGGTFITTCTVTDISRNSASSSVSYTVLSSGGSSTPSFWIHTYIVNDEEFEQEQGYTKEILKRERFEVSVSDETHYVGVVDLSSTTATINITSNPIQVILDIGEDIRIDLSNDGFYDLYVFLNDIINEEANLTVKSIYEEIPKGEGPVETSGEIVSGKEIVKEIEGKEGEKVDYWWIWLILAIIILILIGKKKDIQKYFKKKWLTPSALPVGAFRLI